MSAGASTRRCARRSRKDAVHQHDLTEMSLAEVMDDARALSLFASERLIWW